MDLDVTALTDEQLAQLALSIETEQDRREARAEIVEREQQLAAEVLDRLNRQPGDPWAAPTALTAYQLGDQVTHTGKRWASLLTGNVWEPGMSGWREITPDGSPPPWLQPTGAHDAYRAGAIVTHNGKEWRSLLDSNVWPPDTYPPGWELTEPTGAEPGNDIPPDDEPDPDVPAAWSAGVVYAIGDQVTHDGAVYRCQQAHTSQPGWTPSAVPALWTAL